MSKAALLAGDGLAARFTRISATTDRGRGRHRGRARTVVLRIERAVSSPIDEEVAVVPPVRPAQT